MIDAEKFKNLKTKEQLEILKELFNISIQSTRLDFYDYVINNTR